MGDRGRIVLLWFGIYVLYFPFCFLIYMQVVICCACASTPIRVCHRGNDSAFGGGGTIDYNEVGTEESTGPTLVSNPPPHRINPYGAIWSCEAPGAVARTFSDLQEFVLAEVTVPMAGQALVRGKDYAVQCRRTFLNRAAAGDRGLPRHRDDAGSEPLLSFSVSLHVRTADCRGGGLKIHRSEGCGAVTIEWNSGDAVIFLGSKLEHQTCIVEEGTDYTFVMFYDLLHYGGRRRASTLFRLPDISSKFRPLSDERLRHLLRVLNALGTLWVRRV